jgi:WD40 repeat protein
VFAISFLNSSSSVYRSFSHRHSFHSHLYSASPIHQRKVGTFGEHAGSIVSMDGRTLEVLGILKVAKEQIGDMAFSLNGETLAVASNDNFIYLVDVRGPTEMGVRHKCVGHSSFVTDLSLSQCCKWMMSNDGAGEILYWNAQTGKREGDIDIFKTVVFAQNTCPLSWETIGCWPNHGDLTDINSSETSPQCGLAVTADDFGKIKLFNTPCTSWDAPYYVHQGHSSHITNCMWNCDSTYVVSVGGNDRCAMVWRVVELE